MVQKYCLPRDSVGNMIWWRWRDSNPRPKSSLQSAYKPSRFLVFTRADSTDRVARASRVGGVPLRLGRLLPAWQSSHPDFVTPAARPSGREHAGTPPNDVSGPAHSRGQRLRGDRKSREVGASVRTSLLLVFTRSSAAACHSETALPVEAMHPQMSPVIIARTKSKGKSPALVHVSGDQSRRVHAKENVTQPLLARVRVGNVYHTGTVWATPCLRR